MSFRICPEKQIDNLHMYIESGCKHCMASGSLEIQPVLVVEVVALERHRVVHVVRAAAVLVRERTVLAAAAAAAEGAAGQRAHRQRQQRPKGGHLAATVRRWLAGQLLGGQRANLEATDIGCRTTASVAGRLQRQRCGAGGHATGRRRRRRRLPNQIGAIEAKRSRERLRRCSATVNRRRRRRRSVRRCGRVDDGRRRAIAESAVFDVQLFETATGAVGACRRTRCTVQLGELKVIAGHIVLVRERIECLVLVVVVLVLRFLRHFGGNGVWVCWSFGLEYCVQNGHFGVVVIGVRVWVLVIVIVIGAGGVCVAVRTAAIGYYLVGRVRLFELFVVVHQDARIAESRFHDAGRREDHARVRVQRFALRVTTIK